MTRKLLLFLPALLLTTGLAHSQDTRNLVANGGFEAGAEGWHLVLGGYGKVAPGQGQQRARCVGEPVHAGKSALLLDAVGATNEVDAYSQPIPVRPNYGYRLTAFVRQLGGTAGYKVTIDWQTADGNHISYANDWQGNNQPSQFTAHGGVFAAPDEAGRAVLILGVQKDVKCVFDDISLTELGPSEPLSARPRHDGDGTAEITGPDRVEALGNGTWKVVYTCGASGLPVGGAIVLHRYPVSFDWSPPQADDPSAAGFVRASGPRNAQFQIQAGRVQEVIVRLEWPALLPGDRVEITVGDRSGGGPGMRVQGKLAQDARWIVASDCDADGEYADLTKITGGGFAVVPGPPASAWVVAPAVATVGEESACRVEVRDAAGNPTDNFAGRCRLACSLPEPNLPAQVEFRHGELASHTLQMKWTKPGVHEISAAITGKADGGKTSPAWVVVSAPAGPPTEAASAKPLARVDDRAAVLENSRVAVVFPRNADGFTWGCGKVWARIGDTWQQVATLPAVGRVAFAGDPSAGNAVPGRLFYAASCIAENAGGEARLRLTGTVMSPRGAKWPFTATYTLAGDSEAVRTELQIQPVDSAGVVALHAPLLYAGDGTSGERKDGALFPGLEFLSADEMSSDDYGVGWPLHTRTVPHPYKITVPLMAVAEDSAVVGLCWNPLQKWDGTHPLPLAHFSSPNREEGKPDHLMSLLLPGYTDAFTENSAGVASGWTPPSGATLSLSSEIFALAGTHDVAAAVQYWARGHSLPAVTPPRSWTDGLALSVRGLTGTAWNAAAKGWIPAVGKKPGFNAEIADELLQFTYLHQNPPLAAQAKRELDAALRPQGPELNLRLGDAARTIAALRENAYAAMATQHPDGSWTFADAYSTAGARSSLARPGDVEIGTCVNMLDGIFRYAVATGDPKATAAGLRGLDYIRRFTKPAGSESWEVPLVDPNLRAAALACRCFLRGWQLTGNADDLDQARRWAWAGLAFVYLWHAPDRPVMPGATVSVMGTTFYFHPWFGAPVQWVGLVYAQVLRELAGYDNSYDWRKVADLITASAMRQQKTPDAPCHHVGLMPDSYSILKGADYYEWCLAPTGITANLLDTMGYSADATVATVAAGQKRIHVTTVARLLKSVWDLESRTLRLQLRYFAGQSSQIVIYGLSDPKQVTWEGHPLHRIPADAVHAIGWFPAVHEHCIVVRLAWRQPEAELVISGATLTDYAPPSMPTNIVNGGFENGGLAGWSGDGKVSVDSQHPHSGHFALLITAPDPRKEGQATSDPVAVKGGGRYRLQAWVRQLTGDGSYKVTIDWQDAGGRHIAFANDWQGNNRPRQYVLHGGDFTAPADATQARIILGCRGATCLFDDVALDPIN